MGDILDLPSRPDSGWDGRSLTPFGDISGDLPEILRAAAASAMWAGASVHDAQDIAQDLVLELCAAKAAFRDKQLHEPGAWARVAARRQALARAGRRSRETLIPPDSHVLGGGADYDIAEDIAQRDQLLGWVSRLPEEQQAAIALSVDGFRLTEIAHHLNIPLPLARDRLKAAREALRTALVDQLEEDRRAERASQDEFARGRGSASRPQAVGTPSREDTDLAALPPRQQEVLRLSRDGYKPAQIARALAISPNTVRVNLFHARKRIRQLAGAALAR